MKSKKKRVIDLRWLEFPITFLEVGTLFLMIGAILSFNSGFKEYYVSLFLMCIAGWRMLKLKGGKRR